MREALLQFNWMLLVPELIILLAAALLSIADLILKEKVSRRSFGYLTIIALAWAVFYLLWYWGEVDELLYGTYVFDLFSSNAKLLILVGMFLVVLLSLGGKSNKLFPYEGEYYYLLLTATLGAMVIVSSADLITLFVGLELLSISSYVLVGIKKKHAGAIVAAWKYIVTGSIATAFILYGMSFLYGLTGSTYLYMISSEMMQLSQMGYNPIIFLSFFLMIFGFGLKIASAPFHTWAADVYEGAYTPVTALLAVVSKIAIFALVLRVFIAYVPLTYFDTWEIMVEPVLLTVAALSMIIGNTVALRQTNTKRLLAYSGIAQIGYLLIPIATLGTFLIESSFYYLLAYLFMTIGVFAILLVVSAQAGNEEISAFAGLYRRSPLLAFSLTIFLISLAGFPITAGFMGKFYILLSTINEQHHFIWIAAVMIVTTIISYIYYFQFIRQMYLRQPKRGIAIAVPWTVRWVILISLIGTIGMAAFPNQIFTYLGQIQWF